LERTALGRTRIAQNSVKRRNRTQCNAKRRPSCRESPVISTFKLPRR